MTSFVCKLARAAVLTINDCRCEVLTQHPFERQQRSRVHTWPLHMYSSHENAWLCPLLVMVAFEVLILNLHQFIVWWLTSQHYWLEV